MAFLFSGIHFNRNKFGNDIDRFKEKKKEVEFSEDNDNSVILEDVEVEVESESVKKQKKAKSKLEEEENGGLSLFTGSKKEAASKGKAKDGGERKEKEKERNRQIERDALLRKKHGIHISGHSVPSPLRNFEELSSRYSCRPYLLRNCEELGYKEPTPIQRQAIPVLLSGQECFVCAPTGSGKTLAFLSPILVKLQTGLKNGVRAIILSPTRELAMQTTRECKKLAKGGKFHIRLMTRELAMTGDFAEMSCDIIVSTPLRLQHAIRKRKLDLSRVQHLVFDESDKLFELGFVKEIDSVVKACTNPSIIRSLFSATLPDYVEELARTIMHDAVRVIVGRKNSASGLIKQKLIFAGLEEGKLLALRQSFKESLNPPILIFVQSKERARELHRELALENIRVDVIHADLSQDQREEAVDNFRAGKTWVLIATDVIARGMDFKGVNCVINYDFPESASAYIHRIGRCGRAGRTGEAITLFTEQDTQFLRNIANVMVASGCEVPAWILDLPKLKKKKHRPTRESISINPEGQDDLPKQKKKNRCKQTVKLTKIVAQEDLPKPKKMKHQPKNDSISVIPEGQDDLPKPTKTTQGKRKFTSTETDVQVDLPKTKKKKSRSTRTSDIA